MTLPLIIAFMAFFISMVALWLTSDIVKKIESQNEKFVKAHVSTLRDELRELDKSLTKAVRKSNSQDDSLSGLDKRLNEHTKAIEDTRLRIAQLTTNLENLDRSIPSRYRVRIVQADAKADGKPSGKPSIQ